MILMIKVNYKSVKPWIYKPYGFIGLMQMIKLMTQDTSSF